MRILSQLFIILKSCLSINKLSKMELIKDNFYKKDFGESVAPT